MCGVWQSVWCLAARMLGHVACPYGPPLTFGTLRLAVWRVRSLVTSSIIELVIQCATPSLVAPVLLMRTSSHSPEFYFIWVI